MSSQDTIVAIATAPGRGSVGIIRLSGPATIPLSRILTQRELRPRHAHYGPFYNPEDQSVVDQGLSLLFPAPHSLTGEDVLELQGHGGPVVMDYLLRTIIASGQARLAKPGEFSERAFLNDKIDLAQAEAIADLINACSEQAARNAVHSLQGVFSKKVYHLVEKITQLRLYVEAAIDFPEEEIDFLQDKQLIDGINALVDETQRLLTQAQQGAILQEGMRIVITGKPNAGKSSLLNALAGRDTAIVTDIPGTTRDVLREHIHLGQMPLHIIDTAGLRRGGDEVERMGMERAWQEIHKADRILLLVDANEHHGQLTLKDLIPDSNADLSSDHHNNNDDHALLPIPSIDPTRLTIVLTKIDLLATTPCLNPTEDIPQLAISSVSGEGINELSEHLQAVMGYQQANEGGFTARRRHLEAIEQSLKWINIAQDQLTKGAGELVAEDLRQAQESLATISGKISADELLGKIFSSFCIGK